MLLQTRFPLTSSEPRDGNTIPDGGKHTAHPGKAGEPATSATLQAPLLPQPSLVLRPRGTGASAKGCATEGRKGMATPAQWIQWIPAERLLLLFMGDP